ncbi:MAG: hypothetical protein AAB518_00250 [Patescibacteria group bacterium]
MPDKSEALPTQKFIKIEAIEDDILILKNGGLRQILLVSGVNFDLKSEEEQSMIMNLFQGFLNSLNFSVQIFIHSRKLNIDPYLENLSLRETKESSELLKNQIAEYREFIRAFVSENAIMMKRYFIVVPYDPVNLPEGSKAATEKIFGFLKGKGIGKPSRLPAEDKSKEEQIREHIEQLKARVNQVITATSQLDLRVIPLNRDEIVDLFSNLYNPGSIEKRATGEDNA